MKTSIKLFSYKNTRLITRVMVATFSALLLTLISGCSIKGYTTGLVADALSKSGTTYASDEDIELVGMATPFALKTMELILAEQPTHQGLLLALSKAFTQYAYLYVEWPADQMEERDVNASYRLRNRARRLYLRARNYGLHGLDTRYPGFSAMLRKNPKNTAARTTTSDVPLLYWTAASWDAAIALGKDDPYLVADLPLVDALIGKALDHDESFDQGSIHAFLIRYEMGRQGLAGDAVARARQHYQRAVELSEGTLASPYLALAETVSVATQDRMGFEENINRALAIDVEMQPERKLENLAMQERARWLLLNRQL